MRSRSVGRSARWVTLVVVLSGLLAGCMIPLPTVEPLTVIDPVDEVRTVESGGATRATVRLRLLLRSLTVRAADDVSLFRGRFRYNVAEWAPNVEEEIEGDRVRVTVGQGLGSQIPLGEHSELQNVWDVELGRGVPLDLTVDIGAGEAQLDLSGVSLSDLTVTSGNSDLALTFASQNPQPLGTLKLTAGAGELVALGLGNANFDRVTIFGGAGTVDLDFSGTYQRSGVVDVKAGAGKVTVRVPGTIGARVTLAGTAMTGVDTVGFDEQGDDTYVNGAYGVAPLTLSIKVTTGVGSVSLVSQ